MLIGKHIPSNKLYFVKNIQKKYFLSDDYFKNHKDYGNEETVLYTWSVFPNSIGGIYCGGVMKKMPFYYIFPLIFSKHFWKSLIILIKNK